ncbi:FirrV-1-A15 precursor [Feldmannia irregularis virus a]|uniref:FirrV-1-A15 n=1 Tax=Feldmannia irregularis virus a TaxID=231992 RepID=Q6XM72_9PHYC|nr:FirrV-1-A15 precursor [Feldmannia irregularis virus a]AAR26839.1 FirrV-1-A15 precursor [Feldmannia irregularis virus a]
MSIRGFLAAAAAAGFVSVATCQLVVDYGTDGVVVRNSLPDETGIDVTLHDVWEHLSEEHKDAVGYSQPSRWVITENVVVQRSVNLHIENCTLLLLSTPDDFVSLQAVDGSLTFHGAHVSSWDPTRESVDENPDDGRAFVAALSSQGPSSMAITDSEFSYLGYDFPGAWGVTWQDRLAWGVYGDVKHSHVHHNYYGLYGYGVLSGNWSANVVHDNLQHGINPSMRSENMVLHHNTVFNNGLVGIMTSNNCVRASIRHNTVYANDVGISLHVGGDSSVVSENSVYSNQGAALVVLEADNIHAYSNTFQDNENAIAILVGSSQVVLYDNLCIHSRGAHVTVDEGDMFPTDGNTNRPSCIHVHSNTFIGTLPALTVTSADGVYVHSNEYITTTGENNNTTRLRNSTCVTLEQPSSITSCDTQCDSGSYVFDFFDSSSDDEFRF